MLKCKEVAERSSALIDGELGLFEALQMRLHLAMCRGCAAFIEQMRATRDLARKAAEIDGRQEADDSRISAILSRVQDRNQPGH